MVTVKELVSKYIQNTEHVFTELHVSDDTVSVDQKSIEDVVSMAKRYFADAKHYRECNRWETALVSVAYCEGLLDALKFLGMVRFQWGSEAR